MTISECVGIRFVVISLPPFPPYHPPSFSKPSFVLKMYKYLYKYVDNVCDHRLYTGQPYVMFNFVLRDLTSQDLYRTSYMNSLFASVSSLRKFSGASAIPAGKKVYCGMAGGSPLTMP